MSEFLRETGWCWTCSQLSWPFGVQERRTKKRMGSCHVYYVYLFLIRQSAGWRHGGRTNPVVDGKADLAFNLRSLSDFLRSRSTVWLLRRRKNIAACRTCSQHANNCAGFNPSFKTVERCTRTVTGYDPYVEANGCQMSIDLPRKGWLRRSFRRSCEICDMQQGNSEELECWTDMAPSPSRGGIMEKWILRKSVRSLPKGSRSRFRVLLPRLRHMSFSHAQSLHLPAYCLATSMSH